MFHLESLPSHSAVVLVGLLSALAALILWALISRARSRQQRTRARQRSRARSAYARFWDKVMVRRAPRMLTDQRPDKNQGR